MPLVYVTGPTGSGKTSVCEALRNMGFETHDTDNDGTRRKQNIDNKEILTLDFDVIGKLHNSAGDKIIFICGTSPNDLDDINLFASIILLNIHEAEQRERIVHRTNSMYGKEPHQLMNALKWRHVQIEKYQNAGAITIDATQPIKDIAAQIVRIAQSSLLR